MQLGSGPVTATIMSMISLAMEVMDALILLSGVTPIESSIRSASWAGNAIHSQFTSIVVPNVDRSSQDDTAEDEAAAAAAHDRERRRRLLGAVAVQVCLVGTVSLVGVAVQLLALPLNPNEVNGQPVPKLHTLEVLLISLAFEILATQ